MPEIHLAHLISAAVAGAFCLAHLSHLRRRHLYYGGVALAIYISFFYLIKDAIEQEELWRISTFLGTIFVTVGWIVSNEVSLHNSRKQHTINIITKYIESNQNSAEREIWHRYLPNIYSKLNRLKVDFANECNDFLVILDRKLNYFEFIAIGLETGDLDEEIARRSLRDLFCNLYAQTEDYIQYWQDRTASGERASETWDHLTRLNARWSTN